MKNLHKKLENFDHLYITWARKISVPFARFAIFLVYFWFGLLKVLGQSPASPLVTALLARIFPYVSPSSFLVGFGLVEIIIAFLFIIPRLERLALFALILHLITTILPLFLLTNIAWHGFMIPTLEGQYIIKNVLLISSGIVILSSLHPYKELKKHV